MGFRFLSKKQASGIEESSLDNASYSLKKNRESIATESQAVLQDATISSFTWLTKGVYLELETEPSVFNEGTVIKIELASSNIQYPSSCLYIAEDNRVLALFDFSNSFVSPSSSKPETLAFFATIERNGISTRAQIGKQYKKGIFGLFTSSFYIDDSIAFLPDQSANGYMVLRLIGETTDASRQPYAIQKKKRAIENRIALYALSLGPASAWKYLHALHSKKLILIESDSRNVVADYPNNIGETLVIHSEGSNLEGKLPPFKEGNDISYLLHEKPLEKKHAFLLVMLEEIDTLCKVNKIDYFLAYGSLLGAVRHRGFIPWDDDLDLFMTKENYDKFVALGKSGGFPSNRVLEDCRAGHGYPTPFGRYINCETTHINPSGTNAWGVGAVGQVVDIFPLMPIKGTKKERERAVTKFLVYAEVANNFFRSKGNRSNCFVDEWNAYQKRVREIGSEQAYAELEDSVMNTKVENPTHYYSAGAGVPFGEVYEKEWFDTCAYIQFENTLKPVPGRRLEVLEVMYGKGFREFPKDTSPALSHFIESYNLPCHIIVDDYMSYLDKSQVLSQFSTYKSMLMSETLMRRKSSPLVYTLDLEKNVLSIRQSIEKQNLDLASLIEEGRYSFIYRLFSPFYTAQLASKVRYWCIPPRLTDYELYVALLALAIHGKRYVEATTILTMRARDERPFEDDLQRLSDALSLCFDSRNQLGYGNFESALRKGNSVLKEYPEMSMPKLIVSYARVHLQPELREAERAFLRSMYTETRDVEALYVLGKTYELDEDIIPATMLYSYVKSRTKDGMIIQTIDDFNKAR